MFSAFRETIVLTFIVRQLNMAEKMNGTFYGTDI